MMSPEEAWEKAFWISFTARTELMQQDVMRTEDVVSDANVVEKAFQDKINKINGLKGTSDPANIPF